MDSPGLFYIIKNVVLSPIVIGITIVCGLILSFIFYIVSYKQKPRSFKPQKEKSKPIKEDTPSPEEEPQSEET